MFGDLFRICGEMHPNFSPTGDFGFDRLADLQFDQVDDYFGIRSLSGEGDDVPIWLFPLAGDRVVDHHPGPFDGVRMTYGILRNPSHRAEHFYRCVQEFAVLGREVRDHVRDISLGSAPNLEKLRRDVDAVIRYWARQGITVGSPDALAIAF